MREGGGERRKREKKIFKTNSRREITVIYEGKALRAEWFIDVPRRTHLSRQLSSWSQVPRNTVCHLGVPHTQPWYITVRVLRHTPNWSDESKSPPRSCLPTPSTWYFRRKWPLCYYYYFIYIPRLCGSRPFQRFPTKSTTALHLL